MVRKISFKNYKIFRSKQTLELRPITILIGKNNSGKSAVGELLTLIYNSLSGDFSAPYILKSKIGNDSNNFLKLGSSFEDLVYNRNAIISLELEIFDQLKSEEKGLEIIISKSGILEHSYKGEKTDLDNVDLKGFLVGGKKIESLNLDIDYIGAFRIRPNESYLLSNDNFDKIGVDGHNAYPILIRGYLNDNQITEKVKEWYKTNFEGWTIEILKVDVRTGMQYQIALSNDYLGGIDGINIENVGQGIHQAFPLIVRSYMPDKEPTLIIIEEPETHLHPTAHGNLAQRFAESYLADKENKRYLIETHSQNFVLRLRRLIAEGTLRPEDLAIYYVDFDEEKMESSLRFIEVDEEGEVEWWPTGIFNESLDEVIEIRNAQKS